MSWDCLDYLLRLVYIYFERLATYLVSGEMQKLLLLPRVQGINVLTLQICMHRMQLISKPFCTSSSIVKLCEEVEACPTYVTYQCSYVEY